MEKSPKIEDLQTWYEGILENANVSSYDKGMIRLAMRLAERGKKISSDRIRAIQAGIQIKELAKVITEESADFSDIM